MTTHLYCGSCPDENQPDARDPACPACIAMGATPAADQPAAQAVAPVLVRDVAEVLRVSVADVSAALVAAGRLPRSTNMAISGEELLAVAAALAAAPAVAPQADPQRLTPFDAVARAMDMASLLAGSVAMNNTDKANTYAARLRSHLVEYIYPAAAPVAPPAVQPLTYAQGVAAERAWWIAACKSISYDLRNHDMVRMGASKCIDRALGIGTLGGIGKDGGV